MKKLLTIALAILMLLSLAACGKKEQNGAAAPLGTNDIYADFLSGKTPFINADGEEA